ncbi:hypothetical protein Fot_10908 [Forsythia ovata]|uniref:Uncharacterized protein n=1 Tax=Forsythia ovata TaxID=205694 RepID=A0ABD1WL05_9LAMI
MKEKFTNHEQKRKGREKDQDTAPASIDLRQTTLVHTISSQEMRTKRAEKEKTKEVGPEEGGSSKWSLRDKDDLEVLEEYGLTGRPKNHGLPPLNLLKIWQQGVMWGHLSS